MDDAKEGDVDAPNLPVEMVNLPIPFAVAGQQKFQLNVPIKANEHAVADG